MCKQCMFWGVLMCRRNVCLYSVVSHVQRVWVCVCACVPVHGVACLEAMVVRSLS